jgi:hypothetical protein
LGKFVVAVRGSPVLNDATVADAEQAGLPDYCSVISNGSDAPGTVLEDCSPAFREHFAAADVMVAHSWEGVPLSRQHGGPVRLVLPRLYFWKSPKWLTRIELLAEDRPGFWEVRGYHNQGDPWLEERYG